MLRKSLNLALLAISYLILWDLPLDLEDAGRKGQEMTQIFPIPIDMQIIKLGKACPQDKGLVALISLSTHSFLLITS